MKVEPQRVFIVDDHPLLCQAIASLISLTEEFRVCGEAKGLQDALELIVATRPHIVILDIALTDSMGVRPITTIKKRWPKIKILMFSGYEESIYGLPAIRAGASGYLAKEEAVENLVGALRQVAEGKIYLSKKLEAALLNRVIRRKEMAFASPVDVLTDRELEIFELIGQGVAAREIAQRLRLSVKTVDAHRANIREKLRLKPGLDLAHRAIQWVQNASIKED